MAPVASRTILHADMDAFYAAIEQRDRPELRGKPVIVGGDEPRTVVATASYEARKFGVRSAMPGVRARQLCPHGIFVAPRMEVYVTVGEQVRAIFQRYTDLVEPLSLDEAFLDVTGSELLFGDGAVIARRIKQDVKQETQLNVSVGVAASKYVAKVASDFGKPDGLVVVPSGEERAFLAPLPVSRLWGAGPKTQEAMRAAGLQKISDLQAMTEVQLAAAFGANAAAHFWHLANGIDPREVEREHTAKSIGHELTFATDLRTREQVHETLLQLAEQVGRRLRQQGLCGTVVRLKLRYGDYTTLSRQRQIEPSQDGLVLFQVARELCTEAWPAKPGIRLLGVTAAGLRPAGAAVQVSLFEKPRKSSKVLQAMDAIKDRFGEDAIRRGLTQRRSTPWGPLQQGD